MSPSDNLDCPLCGVPKHPELPCRYCEPNKYIDALANREDHGKN